MNGKTNPSLQKKSAARMAAAQCLYTLAITGEERTPEQMVMTLKSQLADNRDEQKLVVGSPIEPDYKLVEKLLAGVEAERAEIDVRLEGSLSVEWKKSRMSPLLVAILQCAIYELCLGKEIKPNIVIDEYTRLTRRFFADAEAHFVHGCLRNIVEQYG